MLRTTEVTCSEMSHLFLLLGFVSAEGKEKEQIMLANIWKTLGGDQLGQETIPLQRVRVMMCAIQNFHIDWMIDLEREDDGYVNPRKTGRICGGDFLLKSEEITSLTKKYVNLYKNRQAKIRVDMVNGQKQQSRYQRKLGEQPTFKPDISKRNKNLAQQKLLRTDPVKSRMSIE